MAFLDIFKGKKSKADEKLKRPSKGVLKRPDSSKKKPVVAATKPVKTARLGSAKSRQASKAKFAGIKGGSEVSSLFIGAPHITEKASFLSEKGVYVFKVPKRANKILVKRAVKDLYGFEPKKVGIVNIPSKTRFSRGRRGVSSGYKKALVYLKEGDKIEIA